MLRYLTAGESHGPQLTAIVEGMPAGLSISVDQINADLARRQGGYGRGGRMSIEKDRVRFLSGVRWGETMGSPITLAVENRDWANWQETMSPEASSRNEEKFVTRPRPGHADLPGAIKYAQYDVRTILERSSARETAVRVAVGAMAKVLLAEFGILVTGFVAEVGGIISQRPCLSVAELKALAAESEMMTFDQQAEQMMKQRIDEARELGDSLGGVVEVCVSGVPIGLGSHVQWDRRLDARLAMAAMSVQAIKGVEIGIGFDAARSPGSMVHDEIYYDPEKRADGWGGGFYRCTNRAGGIEGGISNGEEIVVRAAMKPIPTLYRPLRSVDLVSKQSFEAAVERSDVCAVPAAAVVMEAVVAIEVANSLLEKFAGDSIRELHRNLAEYRHYVSNY